tara:strand:- start:10423 stop:12147 length:1725 start_codon:yes stop_codon:yes gene_type:complete
MDKVSKKNKMIKNTIKSLRKKFKKNGIDGYVIPKNDEFFSEYSKIDRLKIISNFTGSAGYAVILKNKNFLFVDGRYTIQAHIESANNFKIVEYGKIFSCDLFKNLTIGLDPKLFTSNQIEKFFLKNNKIKIINTNLIDEIVKKNVIFSRPFFSLSKKVVGESFKIKINKIVNYLKKIKSDYIFISAPENVAWLLNIRGYDNPNSPIPNTHLFLDNKKNIYLVTERKKVRNLLKEKKIKSNQIIEPKYFEKFINQLKGKKISIDSQKCSLYYENILKKKFKISNKEDPIYLLKSIKNKTEIKNMIDSHVYDGVALTKFLYWMKNINKKQITEFDAQNKLESFRKKSTNYLYPSFTTIAGSGANGAIVHYRATKKNTKKIDKKDIFLCDSGGQYKYGTTDVTRTICFSSPKKNIKSIFTKVLKGHIAVVTSNLNKFKTGKTIDIRARHFLKKINLDYAHGTGHGVGFFSNVHEGPQAISKYNNVKISEGMILSNEPGYYKKGYFGIRIENLLYVKKFKNKLFFENLTLAPIDSDLIDYKQLTTDEKNYLFKYNMLIYEKLSPFLNQKEKNWLVSLI